MMDTTEEPANILELSLLTVLVSVEGIAAVRARAIFFMKVIQPLRYYFAKLRGPRLQPPGPYWAMSAPLHALRDFS